MSSEESRPNATQEDWPNQLEWMVLPLEGFNKTFRSRLKSLDASDWHPDEAGTTAIDE